MGSNLSALNSLLTASKTVDFVKRTVSRTVFDNTNPVGAGIHGSSPLAIISGAVYVEPTCCLDFAEFVFARYTEPERFVESGCFGWDWIDKVDPHRVREGFAVVKNVRKGA